MSDSDLLTLGRRATTGSYDDLCALVVAYCRNGILDMSPLDQPHYECGGQSNSIMRLSHPATGLVFCLIPGGTFLMGSPEGEAERRPNEGPQREVTIAPFLMCQTPCTQEAWQRVTGDSPSHFKGARRPVEQVSWEQCEAFCRKVGLRLPSEAEWEYACRAGTTTPFCFGETITPEQVNYDGNHPYGGAAKGASPRETTDVASFPPNAFGLHDVHGNVWEWCQDTYQESYAGAPTDGSTWDASSRVLRGGGWSFSAGFCRAAFRYRLEPCIRYIVLGFRPARSLPLTGDI